MKNKNQEENWEEINYEKEYCEMAEKRIRRQSQPI